MKKITSEKDFLKLIDYHFPYENGHVTLGRGDDCSIISTGGTVCLSKDLFLENIHFRRSYFSPEDIGYKSLAVNISDIAAMGGTPKGFELGLIIPDNLEPDFLNAFLKGMADLANEYNIILAGGDLSRGPLLGISITIWGEPESGSELIKRGNAQPGDILFTHGPVGLAYCGLHILESRPDDIKNFPECVRAHLHPEMRVHTAVKLAASKVVKGMMDISDGLARDLPRFLNASGPYGADIKLSDTDIHPEIKKFAQLKNQLPHELAFIGGEDYALLAAASADNFKKLKNSFKNLVEIGIVSRTPGIRLNGNSFNKAGFDHFSR
ncbi:thiamine-phosphate kinase [Maridesulfovibrio bastinii]|uniref:thiamine-phosphate kinase n=1 Tax=Maridesulfovibrio bastinii TaxID=47157 RepID=UPI0004157233|nr:thiamine-phosphate kinase [Maridesulfovibrio bastinii]